MYTGKTGGCRSAVAPRSQQHNHPACMQFSAYKSFSILYKHNSSCCIFKVFHAEWSKNNNKNCSSVEMQSCRSPAQTKSNPCNTSVSYGTTSNLTGKGSDYPHKPDAQSSKVMFMAANPLLNFSDPATIYITNFNSKHLCMLL